MPPGKTQITIRLDGDVIERFKAQVEAVGGGNRQSLIDTALREHIRNTDRSPNAPFAL